MKEKLNGKIYEWTDCECPVCQYYDPDIIRCPKAKYPEEE